MTDIPVTRVLLKDGSHGVIRMSITAIKHARRNNFVVGISINDRPVINMKSSFIKNIILN